MIRGEMKIDIVSGGSKCKISLSNAPKITEANVLDFKSYCDKGQNISTALTAFNREQKNE